MKVIPGVNSYDTYRMKYPMKVRRTRCSLWECAYLTSRRSYSTTPQPRPLSMASGSSIQAPFVASLPSKHRRIHASCASLLGLIAGAAICTKLWSASTLVQRIGVTRARTILGNSTARTATKRARWYAALTRAGAEAWSSSWRAMPESSTKSSGKIPRASEGLLAVVISNLAIHYIYTR